MPAWADRAKIRAVYDKRAQLAKLLSCSHQLLEVDHIVPRNGKIAKGGYTIGFAKKAVHMVCGLHVHNNLSIETREANWTKGCHSWPDMPDYTEKDIDELRVEAMFL